MTDCDHDCSVPESEHESDWIGSDGGDDYYCLCLCLCLDLDLDDGLFDDYEADDDCSVDSVGCEVVDLGDAIEVMLY